MRFKANTVCSEYGRKVLFLFSTITFILSFQFNIFGAASDGFFSSHQRDSEALVIGRMIESNTNGPTSHGGFLGRYENKDFITHQYKLYEKSILPHSEFAKYTSSAGFQGLIYSLLDKLIVCLGVSSGEDRLFILKFLTSISLALTLSIFIIFTFNYLGLSAALVSILLIAVSQWLVVFSNNLYWAFYLVIAPFILTTFFFMNNSNRKIDDNYKYLCIAVFISIFLKSLAGYEYMSAIFIAMVTPLVFFSIKDSWGRTRLIIRAFLVSMSALLGFASAMAIHVLQLTILLGSVSAALSVIWSSLIKRTHGNPDVIPEVYRRSLESSIPEVLIKYWEGRMLNLDSLVGIFGFITFGQFICFVLMISIIGVFITKARLVEYSKLNCAILVSTLFSVLAPLSWHVLAKGHSFIHGHINHILWYVPFLFLTFAYIGFFISLLINLYADCIGGNRSDS